MATAGQAGRHQNDPLPDSRCRLICTAFVWAGASADRYALRFSSHRSDWSAIQSRAESDGKEPSDSRVPSGHSASTYHWLSSNFLSSRGLKIGLGYFFAITSLRRAPPPEGYLITDGHRPRFLAGTE